MLEAREHFEQSLAIARELGNRASEGWALCNLADLLGDQGQVTEAHGHLELALSIHRV